MPGFQPVPRRRPWRLWCAAAAVLIATFATLSGASAQPQVTPAAPVDAVISDPPSPTTEPDPDVPRHGAERASSASPRPMPSIRRTISPIAASSPSTPPPVIAALAADGIPSVALDAYRRAAATHAVGCGIPWQLLAGIGRVESDHGRFAGAQLRSDGTSTRRVIGIPLDGVGTALIRDTDGGRLDGDRTLDRAVGPMQFIPSTWAAYGVDGNGDHVSDPFNLYDAAASAARYLCAAGGDLRTSAGQIRAVRAYNDSDAYLASVFALERVYSAGVPGVSIPILGVEPVSAPAALPPVDPGTPLALRPPAAPRSHPATSSTARSSTRPSSPPPQSTVAATVPAPTTTPPTAVPTPCPSAGPLPSASRSPSPSASTTPSPTPASTPTLASTPTSTSPTPSSSPSSSGCATP